MVSESLLLAKKTIKAKILELRKGKQELLAGEPMTRRESTGFSRGSVKLVVLLAATFLQVSLPS